MRLSTLVPITLGAVLAALGRVSAQAPLGMQSHDIENQQISASSTYWTGNRACGSGNARLNLNGGAGSWCAQKNAAGEYLQIDFHGVSEVSAVSTQGRNPSSVLYRGARQWVTSYRIQYSTDGSTWDYVSNKGRPITFKGNKDSNTVVKHNLPGKIKMRYIRFVVQSWHSHISMRAEVYGKILSRDSIGKALGIASGKIRDDQLSASSSWSPTTCNPAQGRAFAGVGAGAWCAKTNDKNQWLQVSLKGEVKLTGVATQSRKGSAYQWVESYFVATSMDGQRWTTIKDKDGADRLFRGNNDWTTLVQHAVAPVRTKFVRFRPQTWHRHVSMRVELYGKMIRPDRMGPALGMQSRAIADGQITSSSTYPTHTACDPINSRYKGKAGAGAWCAASNRAGEYLQVDFGGATTINGIATQGRSATPQWVTKYQLVYSPDGIDWMTYSKGNARVTFDANRDPDTPNVHYLSPPIHARYVRVKVVSWHGHISMRAEFYGTRHEALRVGPAIGLEHGRIPSRAYKASSSWPGLPPSAVRLNGGSSWSARANNGEQWVQVDLGRETEVGGIGTQGRNKVLQWVSSYRVSYSLDGKKWNDYMQGGDVYIFQGNSNWSSNVKHALLSPFVARYVRVHPIKWRGHISMRMELYRPDGRRRASLENLGAQLRIDRAPVRIAPERAPLSSDFAGKYAILRSKAGGGAWCSKASRVGSDFLEIDLGSKTELGGIATQGRASNAAKSPGAKNWVTSYTVEYSDDTRHWNTLKVNKIVREFRGNLDEDSVVTHSFPTPVKARYVRVVPKGVFGRACMRVAVFNSARAEVERERAAKARLAAKTRAEEAKRAAELARAKKIAADAKKARARDVAAARVAAQRLAEAETRKAEAAKREARAEAAKRAAAERGASAAKEAAKRATEDARRLAREKAEVTRDRDALARAHAAAKGVAESEKKQKAKVLAEAAKLREKIDELEAQAADDDFLEARFMNALRKIAALEEMIRQMRTGNQSAERMYKAFSSNSEVKDREIEQLRKEIAIWKDKCQTAQKSAREMRQHIAKTDREMSLAAAIAAKTADVTVAKEKKKIDAKKGKKNNNNDSDSDDKPERKITPELIENSDAFSGPDRFPMPKNHPGKETGDNVVPSVTREDYARADKDAKSILKSADKRA